MEGEQMEGEVSACVLGRGVWEEGQEEEEQC